MLRQLRSRYGAAPAARRSAIGASAVLVVVLAVEAVGLRSGTLGLVLVGAVAAIALAVIVLLADLERAGLFAALACAFTLTWNGWFIGPIRPGDVLILLTLILVLAANPNDAFRSPPWWIKQLAFVIILVATITILFPPDANYLTGRVILSATGKSMTRTGSIALANLGIAFKFIVAVAAIPLAFTSAARIDRRAVRWLAIAFATGAGLSGAVATSDHLGTDFGRILTRIPDRGSRQLGFSFQPNFLAAGLCLAAPIAFWLVCEGSRREKIFGWTTLLGCLGGVYSTGSRGGAVAIVLAIGMSVVVQRRTRPLTPYLAIVFVAIAATIVTYLPAVGTKILRATRLIGGNATGGSDLVRSIVGAQGVRDFQHSVLHGVGLQVSFDASQVYIQELASGGLLLFTGMSIYMLGAIISAVNRVQVSPLAGALLVSLVITLALNFVEADLTDRFYYVPAAILVALMHTARTGPEPDAGRETELVAATVGGTGEQGD